MRSSTKIIRGSTESIKSSIFEWEKETFFPKNRIFCQNTCNSLIVLVLISVVPTNFWYIAKNVLCLFLLSIALLSTVHNLFAMKSLRWGNRKLIDIVPVEFPHCCSRAIIGDEPHYVITQKYFLSCLIYNLGRNHFYSLREECRTLSSL